MYEIHYNIIIFILFWSNYSQLVTYDLHVSLYKYEFTTISLYTTALSSYCTHRLVSCCTGSPHTNTVDSIFFNLCARSQDQPYLHNNLVVEAAALLERTACAMLPFLAHMTSFVSDEHKI
jgi:hypothetical protein